MNFDMCVHSCNHHPDQNYLTFSFIFFPPSPISLPSCTHCSPYPPPPPSSPSLAVPSLSSVRLGASSHSPQGTDLPRKHQCHGFSLLGRQEGSASHRANHTPLPPESAVSSFCDPSATSLMYASHFTVFQNLDGAVYSCSSCFSQRGTAP